MRWQHFTSDFRHFERAVSARAIYSSVLSAVDKKETAQLESVLLSYCLWSEESSRGGIGSSPVVFKPK